MLHVMPDKKTHSLVTVGFGLPKFSLKPKGLFGGGSSKEAQGIVLLSNRPLGESTGNGLPLSSTSSSGITLISKKPLDSSCSDLDGKLCESACKLALTDFNLSEAQPELQFQCAMNASMCFQITEYIFWI